MTGGLRKIIEKNSQDSCSTGCHLNSEPTEYEEGVPSTLPRNAFFELDYN